MSHHQTLNQDSSDVAEPESVQSKVSGSLGKSSKTIRYQPMELLREGRSSYPLP
jgi:hypothetical protein